MKNVMGKSLTAAFFITSFFATSAFSLELKKWPLEEKVASSDFVFIGSVVKIIKNNQDFGYDLAVTTPTEVLKGTPPAEVNIIFNGSIPENQPSCCDTGKSYLFFVSKNPKGDYYPVNGRYGVYPLGVATKPVR